MSIARFLMRAGTRATTSATRAAPTIAKAAPAYRDAWTVARGGSVHVANRLDMSVRTARQAQAASARGPISAGEVGRATKTAQQIAATRSTGSVRRDAARWAAYGTRATVSGYRGTLTRAERYAEQRLAANVAGRAELKKYSATIDQVLDMQASTYARRHVAATLSGNGEKLKAVQSDYLRAILAANSAQTALALARGLGRGEDVAMHALRSTTRALGSRQPTQITQNYRRATQIVNNPRNYRLGARFSGLNRQSQMDLLKTGFTYDQVVRPGGYRF